MSLSPNEKYPGATEADPNYKDSKFKDNNPSTTNNGSPLKALDRNEQLALQEAMMNAAGFDYNGVVDTPQNSQMFNAYKAALSNGANLLSNHNFIIASPDDSQPAPSATPTSYPPGYEVFSGVFANETTGILNLTYIDGRVSFSGGDFYMPVSNTGGLERLTDFVASVADFDGKPRTRGVSFALVGDEYRVTVGVDALEDESANATPLGSVKFEQGSVATGHEVGSLSSWSLGDYTNLVFDSVEQAKSGITINHAILDSKPVMIETKSYYDTSTDNKPLGGARYLAASLSYVRDFLGLPSWIPDGFGSHYIAGLGDGSTYVIYLDTNQYLDMYRFGAVSDGTSSTPTDTKDFYDAYCGWLIENKKGSLFLGDGDFAFSVLTRRNKISVYGSGQRATNIHPISRTGSGQDPTIGLIEVDDGVVQFSNMRNLTLWASRLQNDGDSPVNATQWAIYHRAKWDAGFTQGGLWKSNTVGVEGRNWNYGLWSRAGYTTSHSLLPNQWNIYDSVDIPASLEPWRFTGQHGQIAVTQGNADGPGIDEDVTCVTCDWDPNPSQVASSTNGESPSDTSGVGNAVRSPTNIGFGDGFSTQSAKKAYFLRSSTAISLDGAWIENTQEAIEASTNAECSVENCRLTNAGKGTTAGVGVGNGYIIKHGNNSYVMYGEGNNISGDYGKFAVQTNQARGYAYKGGIGSDISDDILSGFLQVTETSGAIDIKEHPFVVMSSGNLNTILSGLLPGNTVCVRALGGAVVVGNGGNIGLATPTQTIPSGGAALFIRTPGPKAWQIIG